MLCTFPLQNFMFKSMPRFPHFWVRGHYRGNVDHGQIVFINNKAPGAIIKNTWEKQSILFHLSSFSHLFYAKRKNSFNWSIVDLQYYISFRFIVIWCFYRLYSIQSYYKILTIFLCFILLPCNFEYTSL